MSKWKVDPIADAAVAARYKALPVCSFKKAHEALGMGSQALEGALKRTGTPIHKAKSTPPPPRPKGESSAVVERGPLPAGASASWGLLMRNLTSIPPEMRTFQRQRRHGERL